MEHFVMKLFAFLVFYFSIPFNYGFNRFEENRIYSKSSYEEQYSDMNDIISVESGNNSNFKLSLL